MWRSSSISSAPTDLSRAICEEDWQRATDLATRSPKMAATWSKRTGFIEGRTTSSVLPLHEAAVGGAPIPVMEALLRAHPEALVQTESAYQRLPLHCACRKHADPQVIALLTQGNETACVTADSLGRLPLHYALSNGADANVVTILMQAAPASARGVDQRGWTPLHVACSMGASAQVVQAILPAYPEALLIKTRKGSSIMRCIPKTCPHRSQLLRILSEAQRQVEASVSLPRMKKKNLNMQDVVYV
jgi:hypothetical protein